MLAEIRAKKPFNGQRARLTVDGARPSPIDPVSYFYLLSTTTPSARVTNSVIRCFADDCVRRCVRLSYVADLKVVKRQ